MQLHAQYERATDALKQIKVTAMIGNLRSVAGINHVVAFFDTIQRRGDPEIFDPPSQLEWNCWRAMLALDHTDNVRAYQTLDTNLQPLTRAPGHGPDGVAHFDSFDVILEPTLKVGPRQWSDESEPIYRHAVIYTNKVRDGGDNRDIYTLAIAPQIIPDLAAYFLNAAKGVLPIPSMREPPLIVPITIKQMQRLLSCAAKINGFAPDEIWVLFEQIKEGLVQLKSGDDLGYLDLVEASIGETISLALKARPTPAVSI